MARSGFTPEDYEDDEALEVWPENWAVFRILTQLQTQWYRVGMTGQATGLNYASAFPLLDRAFPDPDEWDEALHDLTVAEIAALGVMNRK